MKYTEISFRLLLRQLVEWSSKRTSLNTGPSSLNMITFIICGDNNVNFICCSIFNYAALLLVNQEQLRQLRHGEIFKPFNGAPGLSYSLAGCRSGLSGVG